MKARYYESELGYLREQGKVLARRHPRTAGLLAERSDDPDVERLLEGFAFLAAAVRERIDDAIPQLSSNYAGLLVPQLTRFVPPTSIIEYRPEATGLRGAEQVPRGTIVAGQVASGEEVSFQTTSALVLLPLTLEEVEQHKPQNDVDEVVLSLRASEQRDSPVGNHRLRLFLQGEPRFWMGLRTWFLRHCVEARLVKDEESWRLPHTEIRGLGDASEESLFPEQPLEHDGFTRLAEFFACPDKYAFIELPPLGDRARGEFKIVFRFSGAPKLPKRIVEKDVRLHCTPVINLFETDLEPASVDVFEPWQHLRASRDADAELWALTEVEGVGRDTRVRLHGFSEAGAGERAVSSYYVTRRESASAGAGTRSYVALMSCLDRRPPEDVSILSMRGLFSNRARACELGIGMLSRAVRGAGASTPFSNIKPVSPPLYPHEEASLVWRLGAHVGLSRKVLHDATSLRSVLRMYDFAAGDSPPLSEMNLRWIESIRDVSVVSCMRLVNGAPVTGSKTTVVVDAASFPSLGEACVFGEVLDDVFARRVEHNSFNVFCLEVAPTGARYVWKPRNGSERLA